MATTVISGAAFGAALTAAGFHRPGIVTAQLGFDDWHMVQTFLTATATSAAVYAVAQRLGYVHLSPRSSSPLGLFSKYDGNMVGGGLLGAGMAMSDSCPGTLLAQLAAGQDTGMQALVGGIMGGIFWSGFARSLVEKGRARAGVEPEAGVLYSRELGLSRGLAVVLLEVTCLGVVAATRPGSAAVRGGLLIGGAQLVSIVLRRGLVGVSGSFEEAGNWFWRMVDEAKRASSSSSSSSASSSPSSSFSPCPSSYCYTNVLFATGVVAGAWAFLGLMSPADLVRVPSASPSLAVLGGALMVIGSRVAGGCTSGHGISGISLLSTSSVVTIASAFAAGGLVTPLLRAGST